MRLPSAPTLAHIRMRCTPAALRKILEKYRDGGFHEPHEPLERAAENAMEAANTAIGGCGVEALLGGEHHHPFWADCAALYVNMGDTYDVTLLYDVEADRFRVVSWGDFAEWRGL